MISVQVFTRGNVLIDQIPDVIAPKFQEALNEPGSGSMQVPVDSVALTRTATLLDFGNIVKMTVKGYTSAWLIDRKVRKLISTAENAHVWELSGRGVLALLSDASIYPELIDAQAQYLPVGPDRWFTFVAADTGWYDGSMWDTPAVCVWAADTVEARKAQPVNWPDEAASWMWLTNPLAHCDADTAYFRTTLTLTVQERFDVSATADDAYSLFIDGQLLMSGSDAKQFQTTRVILNPGEHVIAIIGTNGVAGQAGANPAGVIMTMVEVDTIEHEVRLHSSSAWVCRSGNDDPLPGFNPGQVMADLLAEAATRGVDAATAITTTWTDAEDSDGQPWPDKKVDRAFPIGTDLAYVAAQLDEQLCFISMDADLNLSIRASDSGADLTTGTAPVVLRKAHNITDLGYAGDGSGIKSAVATLREGVLTSGVDAVADAAYGRRESFVALGNSVAEAQAEAIRDWVFEQRSTPVESFTISILAADGAMPFDDFGVGDYVLAPGVDGVLAKFRVASLSAETDAAGNVVFVPELATFFSDRTQRQSRWLATMAGGTLAGDVRSAAPVTQTRVVTSAQPASADTTRYGQAAATGPTNTDYIFYLAHFPIDQSEHIYRNGLEQIPGIDYQLVGRVVSMSDPIASDDEMTGHYAWNIIQPAVVENQITTGVYGDLSGAVNTCRSANGRWHVAALDKSGDADGSEVFLSADGLLWVSLGSPFAYNQQPLGVVPNASALVCVTDDGEVFVRSHYEWDVYPGSAGNKEPVGEGALARYAYGGWQDSKIDPPTGWSYWRYPQFIACDNDGHVWSPCSSNHASIIPTYFTADSGSSWSAHASISGRESTACPPTLLHGVWHYPGGAFYNPTGGSSYTFYVRFDVATRAELTITTPPTVTHRMWVMPKPGDTRIFVAAIYDAGGSQAGSLTPLGFHWQYSDDDGQNWTTVATYGTPSGIGTLAGVTMGSDGKLHAWGGSVASGVVTVWESSRNVDGTGGWSTAEEITTHEGSALASATRSYPSDGSVDMEPRYVVLSIANGTTYDVLVVNAP